MSDESEEGEGGGCEVAVINIRRLAALAGATTHQPVGGSPSPVTLSQDVRIQCYGDMIIHGGA